MNRLEKTGICVHKFLTKNSWLEIFTGCNMHSQSTTNHIHIYLKMLVLISFMFLLWTLLDTKQEALNSCSHTTTIQTKVTILLECDIALLGDWFAMFHDNVTVSSTRIKMSECHSSWEFQALDINSKCCKPVMQFHIPEEQRPQIHCCQNLITSTPYNCPPLFRIH